MIIYYVVYLFIHIKPEYQMMTPDIYVMVEADRHLKLLPTPFLDIYKVFEHIHMLSMGIQQQP